ncbi:hypothetical protein D3C80_1179830 [compost metagenome]
MADAIHGAVFAFVDEQVPVELRDKAHVEKMALALGRVFVTATGWLGQLRQ